MKKYLNDKKELHREGGLPAIEYEFGCEYYINGNRHRDGDLPAVDFEDDKRWYQHGKLHRVGNPAIIHTISDTEYSEEWHIDGKLHRDDGAATTRVNGEKITEAYYLEGVKYPKDEWEEMVNHEKWNAL